MSIPGYRPWAIVPWAFSSAAHETPIGVKRKPEVGWQPLLSSEGAAQPAIVVDLAGVDAAAPVHHHQGTWQLQHY